MCGGIVCVSKDPCCVLHLDPFTITLCVALALLDIGILVQLLQGSCVTAAMFGE